LDLECADVDNSSNNSGVASAALIKLVSDEGGHGVGAGIDGW
jgi:hypothetical protein